MPVLTEDGETRAQFAATGWRPWGKVTKKFVTDRRMHPDYVGYPKGPDGDVFFGGKIDAHWQVGGDYVIVEATDLRADNRPDDPLYRTRFHAYVRGVFDAQRWYATKRSCDSFDRALLHAITFKSIALRDGINAALNTQADSLYWRMIGAGV